METFFTENCLWQTDCISVGIYLSLLFVYMSVLPSNHCLCRQGTDLGETLLVLPVLLRRENTIDI